MKQRDLLFAGLLLLGVPAFAQNYDPSVRPIDPNSDPKVIFEQGFEANWNDWSTDSIDVIDKLYYYKDHKSGQTANMWESTEFDNLIERTDSIIPIYRGNVVKTDDASDVKCYENDTYDIITESSPARLDIFDSYGEDGGTHVFKYYSDSNGFKSQWMQNPNTYSPEYRRNLFVRLLPNTITDNTPYRLTFFIKATNAAKGNRTSAPKINADLMRGYFHAEKPFTMGLEDDADHYKYKTRFEWDKTSFTGDWEKVTYMSYYLNDSIANAYVFVHSYYWDDYEWKWAPGGENTTGETLKYIQQPDKFFVRISFAGDNTEYQFDNLKLYRSWIAGANYNADKIRIDFGFKNNIKDLASATKTKQLEVVFDPVAYNFEVWGLKNDDSWEEVYIRSAEYHDDGYLYMFTDSYDSDGDGNDDAFYSLDEYKEVRISFQNPTDPATQLKYTGTGKDLANAFPMALDTNWIKAGKIIPDLVNEIGTPVPAAAFTGVSSMKDLPPMLDDVFIGTSALEDNSFGLAATESFKVRFTRPVSFDNAGESSERVKATVNGVTWAVSQDPQDDNTLVFTRPGGAPAVSGDVEIQVMQIYARAKNGNPVGQKGADIIKNYHFGEYVRKFDTQPVTASNWRAAIHVNNAEEEWSRPIPTGVYAYNKDDGFVVGNGDNKSNDTSKRDSNGNIEGYTKNGLYKMIDDGTNGDCIFYLTARANDKLGNLYAVQSFADAGNYAISFPAFGWSRDNLTTKVYVYKKPAGDPDYNTLNTASKKEIGSIVPTVNTSWSKNNDEKEWPSGVLTYSFAFKVPEAGDYIIEWEVNKNGSQSYYGVAIGNYKITTAGDLSYAYTSALNKSVDEAKARLNMADKDAAAKALYTGKIYEGFKTVIAYYDYNPEGGFKDNNNAGVTGYPVKPTEWTAAKKALDDATTLMKNRMDSVDKFVEQRDAVTKSLADNKAKYEGLSTYAALQAVETAALAYDPTVKTGKEIYAYNEELKKAIQKLDDRIAINKKFSDEIAKAAKLIGDSVRTDYPEFAALALVWGADTTYNKAGSITATDDELNAKYDELLAANNAYDFKVQGYVASTKRVKALNAWATELGAEIVNNAAVKAIYDALESDDDKLAEIYKTAIVLELYKKAAANANDPKLDSIDVTPFIKNYNLYSVAAVGENDNDGFPIVNKKHPYNDNRIYVFPLDKEFGNALPGWMAKSVASGKSSNNKMATCDDSNFSHFKAGVPVFDGMLSIDWNSKAELKTTVEDLPAGYYFLGVELVSYSHSGDIPTTLETKTVVNEKDSTLKVTAANGAKGLEIDSITVIDGNLSIDLWLGSGNGQTVADNFTLAYRPFTKGEVNYTTLQTGLQDKIDALLTIVDAKKAVAADVEYYTLGGIKLLAPKSGEILIRKTTVNGKVVVDKVLIK
jgi:hypothetical protein